eukprot:2744079-Lingulodinium_polyedra.AAC.1
MNHSCSFADRTRRSVITPRRSPVVIMPRSAFQREALTYQIDVVQRPSSRHAAGAPHFACATADK